MNRRDAIIGLGAAVAMALLRLKAQEPKKAKVIGALGLGNAENHFCLDRILKICVRILLI